MLSGIINLNKPAGPTSHDVVEVVRRGTAIKRIGHAGTLDPLASGVLILCIGPAARLSEYLSGHDKRYTAMVRFGARTATYDAASLPFPGRHPDFAREAIVEVLPRFMGPILQRPPSYSAIKTGGRRAYDLARAGQNVDLPVRPVTIYSLEVRSWNPPNLVLDVHCSAGTYIRSLAHDLGEAMGTGAYLFALTRTQAGPFQLKDAVELGALKQAMAEGSWRRHLIAPAQALGHLPAIRLDAEGVTRITHGQTVPRAESDEAGLARALDDSGRLVAVVRPDPSGEYWQPEKVLI